MRLWTLHPKYIDARGLVALWREGLLAQAVLSGKTRGYVNHPQLDRFRNQAKPVAFIAEYLRSVHDESLARGYKFAADKIVRSQVSGFISVTRGQLDYEWQHLMSKLYARDPQRAARLEQIMSPEAHPLFRVVCGEIEPWEKTLVTSVEDEDKLLYSRRKSS